MPKNKLQLAIINTQEKKESKEKCKKSITEINARVEKTAKSITDKRGTN